MIHFDFSRTETRKIVFVWDRSTRFVDCVDRFIEQFGDVNVHSVHTMPRESIISYGACNHPRDEMSSFEKRLHREYRMAGSSTRYLQKSSRFEVLFGDRIGEIVRFAEVIKADLILTPRFKQTSFSNWLLGDLNERIVSIAKCPIVFLEDNAFRRDSFTDRETRFGSRLPPPRG